MNKLNLPEFETESIDTNNLKGLQSNNKEKTI